MALDKVSISVLRDLLSAGSDDDLECFLCAFAVAEMCQRMIDQMSPEARRGFLLALRQKYAEDFATGPPGSN